MSTPQWQGVTASSRGEFSQLVRKDVNDMSVALSSLWEYLSGCSVLQVTEQAFWEGLCDGHAEIARLSRVISALPPVPGAPAYAPRISPPLPSPTPLSTGTPCGNATPCDRALAAMEAYRESLVRAVDFLGAAAEGLATLETKNVTSALENLQLALLTCEDTLKGAVESCTSRVTFARKIALPLGDALGKAQMEASARVNFINAQIIELESALGEAREAMRACKHASLHPLHPHSVLRLARNLAHPHHATPMSLLSQSISSRLTRQPREDTFITLPGISSLVNLGTLSVTETSMEEEVVPITHQHQSSQQPLPERQPSENVLAVLKSLTSKQRSHLLSLLPHGWRPGQPLPPNIPDFSTLLTTVRGIGE